MNVYQAVRRDATFETAFLEHAVMDLTSVLVPSGSAVWFLNRPGRGRSQRFLGRLPRRTGKRTRRLRCSGRRSGGTRSCPGPERVDLIRHSWLSMQPGESPDEAVSTCRYRRPMPRRSMAVNHRSTTWIRRMSPGNAARGGLGVIYLRYDDVRAGRSEPISRQTSARLRPWLSPCSSYGTSV